MARPKEKICYDGIIGQQVKLAKLRRCQPIVEGMLQKKTPRPRNFSPGQEVLEIK